jgi:hypothetical protein
MRLTWNTWYDSFNGIEESKFLAYKTHNYPKTKGKLANSISKLQMF